MKGDSSTGSLSVLIQELSVYEVEHFTLLALQYRGKPFLALPTESVAHGIPRTIFF